MVNLCKCGCGQITEIRKNKPNKFIRGHNSRGKNNPMYGVPSPMKGKKLSIATKKKMSLATMGAKSHFWKNGIKHSGGYVFIRSETHPSQSADGYVKRSRLVMEQHLERYLTPIEVVHHINKIRDDDRIENLKLFANQSAHTKFHNLTPN